MTRADVLAVADGRMFMAADAVKNGLIDGIATMDETLASLRGTREGSSATMAARTRHAKNRHMRK